MENLQQALSVFTDSSELAEHLAKVLDIACEKGSISYEQVETLIGDNGEGVLLQGWQWRLLIPRRTSRCGEWDDRILLTEPGEIYELPNIAKYLVENARNTGKWDVPNSIRELFKIMREPAWQVMPELVALMGRIAVDRSISAFNIKHACRELGLEDRVDTLIAILKGSGVMSPKLGALAAVIRTGAPLYELNPCLYLSFGGDEENSR
ncbi:MAG: hypothetical protein SVM79_01885 [Chloroflexota bacterium]|nr:hypothetical protein [Chloroflexota bacterium]